MIKNFHAARWDEPLIMEMGSPGRRGFVPPAPIADPGGDLVPPRCVAAPHPTCPEISEPEVLRHYLHLSQQSDGHGRYQPVRHLHDEVQPAGQRAVGHPRRPCAEIHPHQDDSTVQGLLETVHGSI